MFIFSIFHFIPAMKRRLPTIHDKSHLTVNTWVFQRVYHFSKEGTKTNTFFFLFQRDKEDFRHYRTKVFSSMLGSSLSFIPCQLKSFWERGKAILLSACLEIWGSLCLFGGYIPLPFLLLPRVFELTCAHVMKGRDGGFSLAGYIFLGVGWSWVGCL